MLQQNKIAMGYLLQSAYINTLNPLYRLTGRINDRARTGILFVLSLIVFTYFVFKRSSALSPILSIFFPTTFDRHLFGIVLLVLLSIFSINQPLEHVEWKKVLFIPQFLMGLVMVIIGFIHPIGIGYQTFGFMLMFVFPCLYFVWNNRQDYDLLFDILVYAMLVANIGMFLYTFYCATKGELTMVGPRCVGIMGNVTCFSLLGLEMVLGAIYLLSVKQFKWSLLILLCSTMGAGLGVMIIAQTRFSFIILFLCMLASLIFVAKYRSVKINKRFWVHLLVGLFIIVQMTMLSVSLVQINTAAVESKIVAAQETTEQPTNPTPNSEESSTIIDRFSINGRDANSFSTGRIFIWKNYARELNVLGNNFDEYDLNKMTGGLSGPYAHNIFLEVGYRCGVPAGLLAVFILFAAGIIALQYLFLNKNKDLYLLFAILNMISYAINALLDCAVLPFVQAESLLFYFAMIVFIDARVNK